ncbi:hypothetical protein [Aquabacter sediminis]|uniref:hypothetical protein n=1 Tax=Aquabacter sediminis TaxID=3029197 RepID=UPI00237EB889|nr:hypothetical protein [Aquabacter sp. P-9]MDE1571213.1 hypothetical protein [Aquabacter sp. P-9]
MSVGTPFNSDNQEIRRASLLAAFICRRVFAVHTVALDALSSVPPWEVAAFLGHRMPGLSVTEVYAHADPAYMAASREALQKLVRAILAPVRIRREQEKQAA